MNFDGALKIYYSVKYEWWSGMVEDEFENSFYYVGPSEMRYFLYYNKFNYNYELNNELFTIQNELCDDLTLKQPEEYLKTLVDKPIPYVADLNKKQFELTSKYLSYWESELTYNPESELHKRRIRYLQTVRGELKIWFENNGIKTLTDANLSIGVQTKSNNHDTTNEEKYILHPSLPSQREKNIEIAIQFINDEIIKLKYGYNRKNIVEIVDVAYKKIIAREDEANETSVAEFLRKIYPQLLHNINDWTEKQFISYAQNIVSK